MKILIYNKYMATMGGGEKHIGAVIEYLSKNNEVTVLADKMFDIESFKNRLNIDLSRIKVTIKKTDNNWIVSRESYNYDLFINSTYQSTVIGCAKKNISFLFFPINVHSRIDIKYKLLFRNFVENFLLLGYKFISPMYSLESYNGKLGNWVDPNMFIFLNHKLAIKEIKFTYINASNTKLENRISGVYLNNKRIDYHIEDNILIINIPQIRVKKDLLLVIKMSNFKSEKLSKYKNVSNLGVFLTDVTLKYNKKFYQIARTFLDMRFSKLNVLTYIYQRYERLNILEFINHYDLFIANSDYTKYYTKKFLAVDSKVLYPPIDTNIFYPSKNKKNYIISVGRFFFGSHNKKHLEMIKTFKKMYDSNEQLFKGWEYHICGGVEKNKIHQMYFEKVKEAAVGYPIFIHENIRLKDLIKLYSESKIFWHAAGYMENEDVSPEKFEHFGITTVEAMSAGCVPIVINKAGQKQIIQNGENGILWDNDNELIQNTITLVKDKYLMEKISKKAITTSKKFSRENFNNRTENLIGKLN